MDGPDTCGVERFWSLQGEARKRGRMDGMTSAAKYEAQSPQSIMNHFKAPERRPSWFMVSLKQWRKSNAIAPEPPPSADAIEAKAADEEA